MCIQNKYACLACIHMQPSVPFLLQQSTLELSGFTFPTDGFTIQVIALE